uniref:Major vault protein shoulder domain-containing protein n=1 Tax=Amphimedon queenslandica TaxID=400682 RepID=A0A1X7UN80_AMPQE
MEGERERERGRREKEGGNGKEQAWGQDYMPFVKNSARIIRSSVFGLNEKGKMKDRFSFSTNNLVITSIDIQSVEPVDQRTRDALQKSVQLAIEITTNSQEATARAFINILFCSPYIHRRLQDFTASRAKHFVKKSSRKGSEILNEELICHSCVQKEKIQYLKDLYQ